MASLPSGSRIAVATELSPPKALTAISNAVEAVCTSAAHGLVAGDIVALTSGWARLDSRVFRVKSVAAPDSFTLEGLAANTSNLTLFPAGAGVGAFVKVLTWVELTKVLRNDSSGGAAKKVAYRYLESDNEQEINDGFSAVSRTLDLDADAISTPGYEALAELTSTGQDTVVRTTMRKGAVSYLSCTVAMNEEVLMQDGNLNRVTVDISGKAASTRYAA